MSLGVEVRTGRPVAKIEMSAEVAGILEGYTQRRKTAQALALRARIVLVFIHRHIIAPIGIARARAIGPEACSQAFALCSD